MARRSLSLDQIHPAMRVCDSHGEAIGTVVQAYGHSRAARQACFATEWQCEPLDPEIIEAAAEAIAPGKRLYLPLSAFREATEDRLMLAESREALEHAGWHGWDTIPPHLSALLPLLPSSS